MLAILCILFVILLFVLFNMFVKPMYVYLGKTTHKIRETVFPDLININTTIVTLSSASIVLTVQLIGKPFIGKNYLLFSWTGFSTCIAMGVLLLISQYTHRVTDHLLMKQMRDMKKAKDDGQEQKEWAVRASELLKNEIKMVKIIYMLISLQVIVLFISLLLLVEFGFANINIIIK